MSSRFDEGALSAACGRPVRFFAECGSTNRVALALGEAGAPSGTLVVADAQSAGRGRLSRSWQSPPGLNLYLSLLWRPQMPPERIPLISLAAAVGLSDVIPGARIKWPNDLLGPDGKKLSGILAEARAHSQGVDFVVVGVGVNVNQRELPPDLPGAGSLIAMDGVERDRAALCGQLVAAMEGRLKELERDPEAVLEFVRARSATLGRRVSTGDWTGVAAQIRSDGALILDTDQGEVPVLAGDVSTGPL